MNVCRMKLTLEVFFCFAIFAVTGCGKVSDKVRQVSSPATAESLAFVAMNAEQWDEAIAQYRKVVKAQPENGNAWLNLGFCLMKIDQHDEAMKTQIEAAKFGESTILANYNIACIHSLKKDADKAFEFLKKAIDLGFDDYKFMTEDPDFDFIRSDPRYAEITSGMVKETDEFESLDD